MERQRFTAEFKREAVRLLERGDKPVSQLALELGVPRNRLYKWRDAIAADGALAFRDRAGGRPSSRSSRSCAGRSHGWSRKTRS